MTEADLRQLVRECVKTHSNPKAATAAVLAAIDDRAARSLLEHLTEQAVQSAVLTARHDLRVSVKLGPRIERTPDNCRRIVSESMLDSWFVGAKRLGDCVRDDLSSAALAERKSAAGHGRNAGFYELVAARLTGNKIARKVFNDDALRLLWNKTSVDVVAGTDG